MIFIQARTLRLLASAYLDWESQEHWQKALNAVELANTVSEVQNQYEFVLV